MTASPPENELIFHHGLIHTLDEARPTAAVLAVRGTDIIYVGDDLRQAQSLLSGRAEKIDLENRVMTPGLTDGHAHFFSEGLRLSQLDLHGLAKEEILEIVRREAQARPAGSWIRGYGWNQELWPGQNWPDRCDLDSVAPHHPVALDRTDKHSIWANTRALEAAGIGPEAVDPPGGEFLRDARGNLTGLVIGWAMSPLWAAFPEISPQEQLTNRLLAQAEYFSYGVTSVMEAGSTMGDLETLRRGLAQGDFKMRFHCMLLAGAKQDEIYFNSGGRLERGLYGERLSIAGTKIHSDGSLGSRSAWMLADYADRPGHRGAHNFTDDELKTIMERARDHNFQVSIHAIGDAAVAQAVKIMGQVLAGRPKDSHRWRVEHFQVVTEEDLKAALELGLVISLQTVGIMTDLDMAEIRLGPERIKRAYNWREILDGGGLIVNGSDGPVESINPFQGLYAAVTRRNLAGRPAGGWRPEHRLTRLEALKGYTIWSAWSEFNENRKGSLTPGKLADLAVLDRDPLTSPEDELQDIRAVMTFSGGQKVHDIR